MMMKFFDKLYKVLFIGSILYGGVSYLFRQELIQKLGINLTANIFLVLVFWLMFGMVYLICFLYEKEHKEKLHTDGKLVARNRPYSLWLLLLIFFILMFFPNESFPKFFFPFISFNIVGLIGFLLSILGMYYVVLSRTQMNGMWNPHIINYGKNHKILKSGVYENVRHPLYFGQFLLFVGTVIIAGNFISIILPIILFIANVLRALKEEKCLLEIENVKEQYQDYINKTPSRFIPGW